ARVKSVFIKDMEEKSDYLKRIIKEDIIKDESDTLSNIAHTFKGNADYFGLSPLQVLAKELDTEFKEDGSEKNISNLTLGLSKIIEDIISINK
ncbi:MAG: Hpt domain-containing protein, partial [Acidobacteriota bacterium]